MKVSDYSVKYLQRLKTPRGKAAYRCGTCRTSRILKREIWEYIRIPKCTNCSAVNWRIDMNAYNAWKNKTGSYTVCKCNFVYFPHKPKSVPECEMNFIE